MPDIIRDGTGQGYYAAVNSENRLKTQTVSETQAAHANEEGDSYNINTGIINMTVATEESLLYFKNNEDQDFIIEAVVIGVFTSANGDGADMLATFIRNPTTGDIITGTDAPIVSNRNYGSNKTLNADVKIGSGGAQTNTNGTNHILVRITEDSRSFISINEVVPKGTSFGVNITPGTGNDGMNLYIAVVGYLLGES